MLSESVADFCNDEAFTYRSHHLHPSSQRMLIGLGQEMSDLGQGYNGIVPPKVARNAQPGVET